MGGKELAGETTEEEIEAFFSPLSSPATSKVVEVEEVKDAEVGGAHSPCSSDEVFFSSADQLQLSRKIDPNEVPPKLGSAHDKKLPPDMFDPKINMESVGRRGTCMSLSFVYGTMIAIICVLYLAGDTSNRVPCPLTNDTVTYTQVNGDLPVSTAELLGRTVFLGSENPDTVYTQGGYVTLLGEQTGPDYLATVWVGTTPGWNPQVSATFSLDFISTSPWDRWSEDENTFVVDVDMWACNFGGDCTDPTALKLLWSNDDGPLNMSSEQDTVLASDGSTLLHRVRVDIMYTKSFMRLDDLKGVWASIHLYPSAASEAVLTLNADGFLGDCESWDEPCSVQLGVLGRGVDQGRTFLITVTLLCLVLAFDIWWLSAMYRAHPRVRDWPRQQVWLLLASFGMFLFVNPIFTTLASSERAFRVTAAYISEVLIVLGTVLLSMFFACFADMPRRRISTATGFYGPKIAFLSSYFALSLATITILFAEVWAPAGSEQSYITMVSSWTRGRQICFVVFGLARMLLTYLAIIWFFVTVRKSMQVMDQLPYALTRTLQLQFRYFGLVSGMALFLLFLGLVYLMVQPLYSALNFSYLDPLSKCATVVYSAVSNPVAGVLSIFIFVFIFTVQFLFMPVKASGLRIRRRPPYCLCESDEMRMGLKRMNAASSSVHLLHPASESEVPILVVERARWLMWLAKEAYRCYDDAEYERRKDSNPNERPMDLSLHDCELIEALKEPEGENLHDTHCIIARHLPTNRLIVSWRGTVSSKQMKTDLEAAKISINLGLYLTKGWKGTRSLVCCKTGSSAVERDLFDATLSGMEMAATGIVYGAADMMGEAADTAANAIGHKNRPSGEELEARKVEKARKITAKSLLARDDTTLPQYLRDALEMSGRTIGEMKHRHSHTHVHFGFWSSYNRLRERVHRAVTREMLKSPGQLWVVGHSLGGALATHCAYDMALWVLPAVRAELLRQGTMSEDSIEVDDLRVHMCNYGSPRVGSSNYAWHYNRLVPDTYRIISDGDLVTGVPPVWMGFHHVGTPAYVDNKGSGSIMVNPMPLESHLNVKRTVNVLAHLFPAYQRALDGCMDPLTDATDLENLIRDAYQKKTRRWIRRRMPAVGVTSVPDGTTIVESAEEIGDDEDTLGFDDDVTIG